MKKTDTKFVLKPTLGTKVGLFCTWYQNDPDGTTINLRYDTKSDPLSGPNKENARTLLTLNGSIGPAMDPKYHAHQQIADT